MSEGWGVSCKSGEVRKSSGVLGELEEEVGLLAAFKLLVMIHAC